MADHGSHLRHDRFAIAAAISGGPAPATLRTCSACGDLYADLLDLRHALRHAWTPMLGRDLRLSTADEARLRPTRWHSLMHAFGRRGHLVSRQLAWGFATLGVAGLLLMNLPSLSLGSMASAPAAEAGGARSASSVAPAAASTAPSVGPVAAVDHPIDVSKRPTTDPDSHARQTQPDRPSAVLWLSIGFLLTGIALLALSRSGSDRGMR